MDPKTKIISAAQAAIAKQVEYAAMLSGLDREVAAAAMDVFDSAEGAAAWLTDTGIATFCGRTPVELARTAEGKLEVMQTLGRIEHGVF